MFLKHFSFFCCFVHFSWTHLIKSSGTPGMRQLYRGHTHHRGPCNFCPLPLFFQYSGLAVRSLWPLSFPQVSPIPEFGCTRLEHPPHLGAICRILSSSAWGNIHSPVGCWCWANYEGSFPSHRPCPFSGLFPSHLSHPLPASLGNRSSLHCTARVWLLELQRHEDSPNSASWFVNEESVSQRL